MRKTRFLAMVLCVAMVLSTMGFTVFAGEAKLVTGLSGAGTENDPFVISNVDELIWFRDNVNKGNTYEGEYVALTADIDLKGHEESNVNHEGKDVSSSTFRPIGDYASKASFKGTFDGGNKTISNLYISGWDINYHWDNYGSAGLFGTVENATIKNLTVEGFEIQVEAGDVAAITGHAIGDCTFENITITNSKIATYNNGCAGIVAWSEAGNYTFKGVTVTDSVVLAGLWGSFDSSIGGVLAQADEDGKYIFEDVDVACRLDCYNDVTAAYKWYSYRMCGMLIGRMTTLFEGKNEVDPRGSVTFKDNVNITIGEWANYTYAWDDSLDRGCQRIEAGYTYGGVNVENYPDATIETIAFNTIIGGPQSQSVGYYGSSFDDLKSIENFDTSTLAVKDFAKAARAAVQLWAPSDVARSGELVLVDSFETLEEALEAAEDGYTIKLIKDIELNTGIVVSKDITLDLNGKTITGTDKAASGNFALITNKGTLTVDDSVGTGAITLTAENDRSWNALSAVISNEGGTLIVKNGKIEHLGGSAMAYGIDNNSTLGETKVVVKGGTIASPYRGIRAFQNSKAKMNSVVMEGGKIVAKAGIWMHQSGADSLGEVTVTGGKIEAVSNAIVTDIHSGAKTTITIKGGEFSNTNEAANLLLVWPFSNMSTVTEANETVMNIEGGSFDCAGEGNLIGVLNGADANTDVAVSGGIFSEAIAEEYIADGFKLVSNSDGTYGVKEDTQWTTDIDAGYYMSANEKLGLMRYLFHFGGVGTIDKAGIKFIRGDKISEDMDNFVGTVEGNAKTFYGDINKIPENTEGKYYAVGFVTIGEKTYWSNPIFCEPNFTRYFSTYTGGAE